MNGVKRSPGFAALIAALIVAVVVAYVLRPAQLSVHPAPAPTIVRSAEPAPNGPVRTRARPLVYVAGAVVHPGVYAIADDARARDALAAAGGATHDADLVAVNLAAHIADGDEIAVPHIGEAAVSAPHSARRRVAGASGAHRRHPRRRPASTPDPNTANAPVVDVNTADESELAELPGIGPTLAARIVEFRTLNGPFVSIDGLADVAGITPARLDELEPLISVGRATSAAP
jgi:competence protein ComEA